MGSEQALVYHLVRSCSSAESTLIGCGSIHSVSLDDVIDTLAYTRALREKAGLDHKIEFDLGGLARMQESEVGSMRSSLRFAF
eukprot:1643070-Amphidinium_carterae.1